MDETRDLPIHPRTGLRALDVGRRGPIWPIMGGSEDGGAGGEQSGGAQNQGGEGGKSEEGGDGNGANSGPKRDPLYADLPDDHPLVKRHEALKAENKVLRPKAKQVDDAEAAKRTDAEKIADLQTQVDGLPKLVAAALREHLVQLHEFDKDDADLFLTGDTAELVLKQASRLLEQSGAGGSKRKNYIKNEGGQPGKPAESENGKFAKSLFGGSDD